MILYISNGTENNLFFELLNEGKIHSGSAVQKFNNSIMRGLSEYENVVSLAVVGYGNTSEKRIEVDEEKIKYIVIENHAGRFHKIWNVYNLKKEGVKIIQSECPRMILCDAIAESPCLISKMLARVFHIPSIGIITDLPGTICGGEDAFSKRKRLMGFDGYILLTDYMNTVVNPNNKPSIIVEGLCSPDVPDCPEVNSQKRIIMYSGGLRRKITGIEYFVDGFLAADIPNCELHFYGIGDLVGWIEDQSKCHPQIKYMGNVSNDEIVCRQKYASLLINPRPSNQEFCKYSFPSKTIEYMVSGVPVLMTRLPGVPNEYFNYVFTIKEETSAEICDTLKHYFSISNDERREFGLRARRFILENKSCSAQSKRIYDFCQLF